MVRLDLQCDEASSGSGRFAMQRKKRSVHEQCKHLSRKIDGMGEERNTLKMQLSPPQRTQTEKTKRKLAGKN